MQTRFYAAMVFTVLLAAGVGHPADPRAAPRDPIHDAERCLARGDTLAAIRLLEHSHLADQTDPRAHVMLGRLWRERGTIEARLRSQRVLEAARARWGRDATVLLELGRTYFAQGFYPDGLTCFRAVLAQNPKNCDARFMVGLYYYLNWKRMNKFIDDLAAARRELRAVVECDPGNADAALMVLYANYTLGDTSSAECDRQLARHPDRFELYMFRGLLDFDAGRYPECAARFGRGLDVAGPAEREAFATLAPVLPAGERDRYDGALVGARATMQRGYWLGADPDPTTPVNELALEHARRMFLADMLFSHPAGKQRGWETDRGEVFVKFGRPLTIDYTLGDDLYNGVIETWSYVLGGVFHQFMFVDEFLNGNPRIPYELDFLLSFTRHTPAMSSVESKVVSVPASADVTVFRDDDLSSSVYVAAHVDADSLRAALDFSRVDHLVARCAYFDAAWNREGGVADTSWASNVSERRSGDRRVLERVCRLSVPFDRYHVAFAFEDQAASARAVARKDADASRFSRDELAVSDILLFDPAAPLPDDAAGATIERGGIRMRPRVSHRYAAGQRVHVYLEAYNLDVAGGVSAYDVRIAIYPAPDDESSSWLDWGRRAAEAVGLAHGEPAVAQSFQREGHTHVDSESVAVDIDALRPGRYRLVVDVTDRHSGERAVAYTPLVREASPDVSER
jgi:GWxTD domain-containing protein